MMREVDTLEEAKTIVEPLILEDKWSISVSKNAAGKFLICWAEHKLYTARNGKEYRDEVWTTEEGDMKFVQDLEPEHAKNILRMILRDDREYRASLEKMTSTIQQVISDAINESIDEDFEERFIDDSDDIPDNTTIH